MRAEPSDLSEMVSQVLFGEHFKIIDQRKKWYRIRLAHDSYEGWIDKKQATLITADEYKKLDKSKLFLIADPVQMIEGEDPKDHFMVMQGARLPHFDGEKILDLNGTPLVFQGNHTSGKRTKNELVELAFSYLNVPYLWGGRSPFGIDCSGFTQMVYRLAGYDLLRDASQQATQGEALSFIEESEPGDLAFFDDEGGRIIHVGIVLENNYIIHASGKVRLDRLDQSGIYNGSLRTHTHRLRVIKKIF